MTNEEAIEELKKIYPKTCKLINGIYRGGFDDHNSKGGIALDIAIKALEKQIPIKISVLLEHKNYFDWECPKCHMTYGMCTTKTNYCPNCSQGLKWE